MPRKQGAVTVARMTCLTPGCGQRVAVYQNTRGYLYTRCGGCGCDQRNGQAHQVRVWQHLEPVAGAVIERPPNVPESAGPIGGALTGAAPAVTVVEPVGAEPEKPVQEPVHEPAQPVERKRAVPAAAPIGAKPAQKKGGTGLLWLLAALAAGVGMVVAGAAGGAQA